MQLLKALQAFTRLKTSEKSALFPVGTNFESLFNLLQINIRFFSPPLPTNSTASLTISLPQRQVIGLTEFHFDDKVGLGSTNPPVITYQRTPRCKRSN